MDRYPTTDRAECPVCHWKYSRTHGEPATCPGCDRAARMEALNAVLKRNSDLKGVTK